MFTRLARRPTPEQYAGPVPCQLCAGTLTTTCPTCRGFDFVKRGTWIPSHASAAESELCPSCNGRATRWCSRCSGSGYEP
jgi:DnaJ-class molecular chaperone